MKSARRAEGCGTRNSQLDFDDDRDYCFVQVMISMMPLR